MVQLGATTLCCALATTLMLTPSNGISNAIQCTTTSMAENHHSSQQFPSCSNRLTDIHILGMMAPHKITGNSLTAFSQKMTHMHFSLNHVMRIETLLQQNDKSRKLPTSIPPIFPSWPRFLQSALATFVFSRRLTALQSFAEVSPSYSQWVPTNVRSPGNSCFSGSFTMAESSHRNLFTLSQA